MTLAARLDILPPPQRALWDELDQVPPTNVLYGGTALALRLGHRYSVDFDFFSHAPLDHSALAKLSFVANATMLQEQPNTLTVLVDRGGPVKVSFFGGIAFGRVGRPDRTTDDVVLVASLIDLAGTTVKALLQRVEAKDYLDIAALLASGMALADILGAASTLYGPAFNPLVAQKALCYFEGGDLDKLDITVRDALVAAAARDVTPSSIPRLAQQLS